MNLITFIRTCLHACPTALHTNACAALPPFPTPLLHGARLRATWLSQADNDALRLHWHADESQEPPSRWRALLSLG
ncbi:hypothetical protein [Pseudomonas sp. UFMG81]|uniref:hypothetical protein n=1 Tax=Pseudomonas sp. UFMG81 TaxID=2745936 RepID=UPI00188FBA6A|nr:hypothetical protein [Pseudomonas sp. UFMG81]